MSLDVICDEERLLWIDRDPEEGFMSIGINTIIGIGSISLSKEEAIRLYEGLKVELQIKGAISWEGEYELRD